MCLWPERLVDYSAPRWQSPAERGGLQSRLSPVQIRPLALTLYPKANNDILSITFAWTSCDMAVRTRALRRTVGRIHQRFHTKKLNHKGKSIRVHSSGTI